MPGPSPLLKVEDLHVSLPGEGRDAEVLRGVSFTLERGQTLGLIGESGCGKSMTALALMGLLPEGARASGSIVFDGQSLLTLDDPSLQRLRGARLAMVFQEPMTALNPVHRIGHQMAEPLRLHQGLSAADARAQALALLERVHMPQAAARLDAYPHQLSGGQRQRVMIAMALACGPDVLIADEPTTALDASLQREVLDLIAGLVQQDSMALLLISHDLGVMAHTVQNLAVMYAGRVVEQGPTRAVFERLAHPYTRGLMAARPRLGLPRGTRLPTLPGRVPAVTTPDAGCAFAPRCVRAQAACAAAVPALQSLPDVASHAVRCLDPWLAPMAPTAAPTLGSSVLPPTPPTPQHAP